MGIQIRAKQVLQVLASANELAKLDGDALAEDSAAHLQFICQAVNYLQGSGVPRSYLAVTAVFLTARALHQPSELSVLTIQAKGGAKGYAASSIGRALAAFSKEQAIDLRARSSQPLNNQPFTFKDQLSRDTKVAKQYRGAWSQFIEIAEEIERMSSQQASEALALLFHLSRRLEVEPRVAVLSGVNREAFEQVLLEVAEFVRSHSDNGAVGQAFAAAMLDLVYGADCVTLGATQDPDAAIPGDVQVATAAGTWLWTEAKQKVIQTGDITGFLAKVRSAGGQRSLYFALANSNYSGYISTDAIRRESTRLGVDMKVLQSPEEALEFCTSMAPGTLAELASGLLTRLRARLVQAECSPASLDVFDHLLARHAENE